jgi:hypothetical protein
MNLKEKKRITYIKPLKRPEENGLIKVSEIIIGKRIRIGLNKAARIV